LLTAWIDYADSSSNLAASQAGVSLVPPYLQVRNARGEWQTVLPRMGFPAGLPKTMTVDLTGKCLTADGHVRIVTSMRIYWDQILVDTVFKAGEKVDVIGTGRGKGFQGVMKRHGFGGGAATHGSMFHRAPGSIGASSFPSRVVKGMRAAGRMGGGRVTTHNLKIVGVDAANHLLVLRGAVPGSPNGIVIVRHAKKPKPDPQPQVEKKKGKK